MHKTKLKDKKNRIIKGYLVIIQELFSDRIGYFYETWKSLNFNALIKSNINFVQVKQSFSKKNALRGFYFQLNTAQSKILRVTQGGNLIDVSRQDLKIPLFRD